MNKQAYAKLMGLQKKAEDLIGPTITPESVKNRARKVEQKEGLARARKNQAANTQRNNIARNIDKEQAAYDAKQRAVQQAQAQARRLRQQKEQKERAQIAKGVDAAVEKHKQQQIQAKVALDALNKQRQRHQQITELVRQNNALKDRQANLKNLAMTDTQKAQARIAEQKLRNRVMKNFNSIFAQAKTKKQELQNKGTFANALKAMGLPVPFAAPAASAAAKPQYGPTIEGAAKIKADREALQKYWDAEAARKAQADRQARLKSYNEKYGDKPFQKIIDQQKAKNNALRVKLGIPEGADPVAFYNKQLDAGKKSLMDVYNTIYPKDAVKKRMAQLNQQALDATQADRVRQGLGNVFDFDKFNKGKMSDAAKAAFAENANRYANYKNKGWWERLLAWIKQMWAGVSGGNPLATERGTAMQAGERAGNIWSGLSDKIRNGLLEGK